MIQAELETAVEEAHGGIEENHMPQKPLAAASRQHTVLHSRFTREHSTAVPHPPYSSLFP
jgi:hypothetical protein